MEQERSTLYIGRWDVLEWLTRDKVDYYQYMVLNTAHDSNWYYYREKYPTTFNRCNVTNQGQHGDIINHNCRYGSQNTYICNQFSSYGLKFPYEIYSYNRRSNTSQY